LQHTIARYTDVLTAAAAVCDMRYAMSDVRVTNYLAPRTPHPAPQAPHRVPKIGIAPFAKHRGKIYPLGKMEKIVAHLAQLNNAEVYLFGGGAAEIGLLAGWEAKYSGVVSLAGKMSLSEEFAQLADMDVVVSMDSANMHMASLVGVTVVTVWGATHPFAGFTGWKQLDTNNIQLDLPCRPCSVFGDKTCFRHDYACMNIPEQLIIEKITTLLAAVSERLNF
jgi:ADP-heptose:LPS heptosyltransferase